ncbi:hypothetical protein AMATHDRAFT_75286 [Amanita thiersii Skay4041]|uniref:Uncharacterized protein n=1 Tax=Amanita thiersii Skay4041 TaxID=703135 RepID=A0A2A9NSZ3_9AGAR|nr:hypothetical protein AMATHDRAFT_75286 [Amanita thiersii Skay4041]
MMLPLVLSLSIALGCVSAQTSLTPNCTAAFFAVSADADVAACLSPTTLTGIVAGGSSAISTIDKWLGQICPAAPCSNSTIEKVVTTLGNGCSSDLKNAGLDLPPATLVPLVQQFYPTVRQVACLKDGNTFCVTQTLNNIQSTSNSPLSINTVVSAVTQFDKLPNNVTCTNCIKASYNIIAQAVPELVSDLQQPLQDKCGASFVDHNTPSGITQTASNSSSASTSSSSSAAGSLSMDPFDSISVISYFALSGLLAILSALAIF